MRTKNSLCQFVPGSEINVFQNIIILVMAILCGILLRNMIVFKFNDIYGHVRSSLNHLKEYAFLENQFYVHCILHMHIMFERSADRRTKISFFEYCEVVNTTVIAIESLFVSGMIYLTSHIPVYR